MKTANEVDFLIRRVKEVWATKKDALREAGDQVVQQLAEATSASSTSQDLPEGIAQQAVQLCANQVKLRLNF